MVLHYQINIPPKILYFPTLRTYYSCATKTYSYIFLYILIVYCIKSAKKKYSFYFLVSISLYATHTYIRYTHTHTQTHRRSYKFTTRQYFVVLFLVRRRVYFIFLVRFCWLLVKIFIFFCYWGGVFRGCYKEDIIAACINADGLYNTGKYCMCAETA